MKANEAPEKLYMNWVNYPLEEMQVEYTRTDAFIEKACAYIKEHLFDYWSQSVTNESKFIEDFRRYLEGE